MTTVHELDAALRAIDAASGERSAVLDRFKAEVDFAGRLAKSRPTQQSEWEGLILRAVRTVREAVGAGRDASEVVAEAERLLAPIGDAAKEYTVHCVGHGHIDMNWMWNWPETVATVNDTFTTVDRLMAQFPDFHFSQSQASVYEILKEYLPELYERVKQRVREGRWEITANQWVEGDKNLASGEILCRHLLYTKRFFKREFGLPYDAVQIDWEPDTFGHAHTVPGILTRGGVRWYYFCRAGHGPQLFWWRGKDGSRVLAFDDSRQWYLGPLTPDLTRHVLDFERATGLKDYLYVYGVGDHGGGPTKRDLERAREMNEWPIFPNVTFSTAARFFSIAEREARDLPVVDREMNFVFEGCYTSQSNVKRANRVSENALVDAEIAALLGRAVAGMRYPSDAFEAAWRRAMFNQFHDILPGSGVKATYEHAQGLFQEVLASTSAIKTRALRAVAERVHIPGGTDTDNGVGPNLGSGPGDLTSGEGAVSRWSAGGTNADGFVIFNPSPWTRSDVITARIWDRDYPSDQIAITDDEGRTVPAQVLDRRGHWFYQYIEVAFPVREVPGCGYRSVRVARSIEPGAGEGCSGDGKGTIENEFLTVVVDPATGAIAHLIDKRSGIDFVPAGKQLGVLEYLLEAPHGMSSWVIGQIIEETPLTEAGATIECPQNGPYLASVRSSYRLHDSSFDLTVSLATGAPRVDFSLDVNWLERGGPEKGVPSLKVAFPLAVENGVATFECPNGFVERSTDRRELPTYTKKWSPPARIALYAEDVPAQKWVDLTGTRTGSSEAVGATLVNATKYGHAVSADTIRLSLLRSSYEPDPLPELGRHVIRFALVPHVGEWSASDATRAGYDFNLPLNVVSTTPHSGDLPGRKGFVEIRTPNVCLSGLKKAEDSDAILVRLYEIEGKATTAHVWFDEALVPSGAGARETDLMETPLDENSAAFRDGVLSVDIPAFGMATVLIE